MSQIIEPPPSIPIDSLIVKYADRSDSTEPDEPAPFTLTPEQKYLMLSDLDKDGSPSTLTQLFNWFEPTSELSHSQCLFLLVYLICLECGFVSCEEYEALVLELMPLNSATAFNFKNISTVLSLRTPTLYVDERKTFFDMNLVQLIAKNRLDPTLFERYSKCSLVASISNDLMIVNLSLTADDYGFSISLPLSRYVLDLNASGKPFYSKFQKLSQLSSILKNEIFLPMRNFQLQQLSFYPIPSLFGLPENIYDNILTNLNIRDRKNLGSLHKRLEFLANQYKLRKSLVHFS